MPPHRAPALAPLAIAAALLPGAAHAQASGAGAPAASPQATAPGPWSVQPYVTLTGTLSDNARLRADKESDFIAQATAGLRVNANAARVSGFVDYALTGFAFARESDRNEWRHALNAFGSAELVERRAFVDVGGQISQQSVSAFGTQAPDPALPHDNLTEVSTFMVSPVLRGPLGPLEYDARLRWSDTRSDDNPNADRRQGSARLQLGTGETFRIIGVSAELSRTVTDFPSFRKTEQDLARAVVRWTLTPTLAVSAIGGRERNDFTSAEKVSHDIWGARLQWQPTPRTELFVEAEDRFFGTAHAASLRHRTPRAAIAFTDSRDVSTQETLRGTPGTAYDLFFQQFASLEPDPVRRQQRVNEFLHGYGIDPNMPVVIPFLASTVTLEDRQDASFGWIAPRDTLTLLLSQRRSTRLDALSAAEDDLSAAAFVRQRGASLAWGHRLTPLSTLNVLLAYQRTHGQGQATSLRSVNARWVGRLGPRSDVSFGARRAEFRSASSPYDETALFGTYTRRF